jgi:phage-related protein
MPGSVQNAAPAAVLPLSLSRAFSHSREYPVVEAAYRNGESERRALASTSRKRWTLTKRLSAAQLQALRDFYDARRGPTEPFYFYDPWETSPMFSYDASGAATQGRYTVRFDGPWEQSCELGRAEVQITLIELA